MMKPKGLGYDERGFKIVIETQESFAGVSEEFSIPVSEEGGETNLVWLQGQGRFQQGFRY